MKIIISNNFKNKKEADLIDFPHIDEEKESVIPKKKKKKIYQLNMVVDTIDNK